MTVAEKLTNDWLDGLLTQGDVVASAVTYFSRGQVKDIKCFDTSSENPIVWTFVFDDDSVLETPLVLSEMECG